MFLVDSHCHLNLLDDGDPHTAVAETIKRAEEQGVGFFLNVGVSIAEYQLNLDTALAYPHVATSVGLHPNNQDEEVDEATLIRLGAPAKVVAVGETGLDYYRTAADAGWQRDRFRTHIRAAQALKKPVIVHTRAAKADTISIMREENAGSVGGVMHCFTEDWAMAKLALDMGFYISFSGIVTFKNAEVIQDTARQVPLDRILIETDAPYLAPIPKRGKINEPGYIRYTAEFLAAMRSMSAEAFAEQTTNNFFNLFKQAVRPNV